MQTKPLKINIPKPCSQNFAEMPKQDDGLYCGQCTKIVYDFSMMTDYELLQFFKTKPDVHCGKFHNSQLNRNLEPVVVKNKFLHKISAIAASVLALVALKPNTAKAQGVVRHYPTEADSTAKNTSTVFKDSINIKGVVKNEKNEALQNVLIKMDGVGETKTDENGVYDFGIITVQNAHNIYYSCPNYVPVVRTYNAVMGNTVMDIVMGHRDSNAVEIGGHTGGVPILYDIVFPSISFKEKSSILTKEIKSILTIVSDKLKQNPEIKIELKASQNSSTRNSLNFDRVKFIKKFLVNNKGISDDRIIWTIESSETSNQINILQIFE